MNISGINSYLGFHDYNRIRTGEAEGVSGIPEDGTLKEQEPQRQAELQKPQEIREQSFTAADYARGYQPDAEYELVGADSDLSKLDVTRAISDMQKDQVLQQYQFFVSESQAQESVRVTARADSDQVRAPEDFSL